MNTLYSKVIWGELGMTDYEIHNHPQSDIDTLIIKWVTDTPYDRVVKVIDDLGLHEMCGNLHQNVDYYDGNFHSLELPSKELYFHDVSLLPFVLMFFIKFPNLTFDLDLIKGITQQLQNKKKDGKEKD